MKACLSDKALLLLHSGEGAQSDRAHLASCLSCARRYRRLSGELREIAATLKRPAPLLSAVRRRFDYPALRWSLAAAALVLAFVGGRTTGFGVNNLSNNSAEQLRGDDSAHELEPAIEPVVADGAIDTPAWYGVYIDNLVGQDESEDEAN